MSRLSLFLSAPYPCGYLPQRMARTAFVDPAVALDDRLYSQLLDAGFRRSGPFVYRPACTDCQACISARIVVAQFRLNRRQRRCWAANADLSVRISDPDWSAERFGLYQRYLRERHVGGEMDPDDQDAYRRFLGANWCSTRHVEFRLGPDLIAVLVFDELRDGLSAVYSFFDPAATRRSLGRMAILWLIDEAQRRSLPYVYLGYWIADCQKMSYKAEYQPLELLRQGRWLAATRELLGAPSA